MHHFLTLPPWFGLALTGLICGAAFWKGDREERIAAGALVACWVATLVLRDRSWAGTQWSGFVIDVVFFAVLTGLGLRSTRYWPLAAAGFQLLSVVTHAARMIDPMFKSWAYATAGVIFTQLVLVAIGVGVWGTWRRRQALRLTAPEMAGATRR